MTKLGEIIPFLNPLSVARLATTSRKIRKETKTQRNRVTRAQAAHVARNRQEINTILKELNRINQLHNARYWSSRWNLIGKARYAEGLNQATRNLIERRAVNFEKIRNRATRTSYHINSARTTPNVDP
jgi:hypothetical protein